MPTLERWRLIPGYGDCYFVSDGGRVLSMKHREPNLMRLTADAKGYLMVQLSHSNKQFNRYLHLLVAEAFHGPRPEDMKECRHLNGIKTDCRAINLKWGTHSENGLDRVRHGTHYWASKTHCSQGHEFTPENIYRRPSRPRSRNCRACQRERSQRQAFRAAGIEVAA